MVICIPDGGPRSSLKCSLKKHGSAPQSWFLNTLIKQSTNVWFLSIHSLYSSLHSTPPLFIVFLLSIGCLQDVDYDMNGNTLYCTLLHSTGIHSSPLRNKCINEWINEWMNEWMNDLEEGKATNEETKAIVCVLYDVWEGWMGREWVSEWEESKRRKRRRLS